MEQAQIETTLYSLSADPPPEPERRGEERHLTLFRVGSIIIDRRRELCLVKNISAGGALIRAYCNLVPDVPLEIELKEQQPVAGKVMWVRGSDAGITFDEPVDIVELLTANAEGPRPRMPRVEVSCVGFVREGAIVQRAVVQNISQGGISVETASPLTVAGDVTVSLPGLPPQDGVVRWKDSNRYGITFNTVLPLVGLVQWLHDRKSG